MPLVALGCRHMPPQVTPPDEDPPRTIAEVQAQLAARPERPPFGAQKAVREAALKAATATTQTAAASLLGI